MAFTDLIIEYPNVLSKDLCDRIIEKFDQDDRKYKGVTAEGEHETTKVSMDLNISKYDDWSEIDGEIYEAFKDPCQKYIELYQKVLNCTIIGAEPHDSGYQVQRTEPGGFYRWHHDYTMEVVKDMDHTNNIGQLKSCVKTRWFTYIFYLNDRTEYPEDGRTQFWDNGEIHSVVPETGKLLMFPANEIYMHRGEELKNGIKYLATGWFCSYSNTAIDGIQENQVQGVRDYLNHWYSADL